MFNEVSLEMSQTVQTQPMANTMGKWYKYQFD